MSRRRRPSRSLAALRSRRAERRGRGAARRRRSPPDAAPQRTITPPKLVHFVEAEFPPSEAAAGKGADGRAVRSRSTATGSVADVKVLESAGAGVRRGGASRPRGSSSSSRRRRRRHAIPVKITLPLRLHVHREDRQEDDRPTSQGTVRDRPTKQPLANVRVALDTGQQTLTDEQGKFASSTSPRASTRSRSRARASRRSAPPRPSRSPSSIDATYEVEPKKEKRGEPRRGGRDRRHRAAHQEAGRVDGGRRPSRRRAYPGTQGDVLKVVENLPGVARAAVGLGRARRLGVGAAGHARLRRRHPRAAPLPRRRIPLDRQLGLRQVGRAHPGRLRRRVRARARRARDGGAASRSTRRASTAAWPPTPSTRRPRCARRWPTTSTSPSPRERATSTSVLSAVTSENVGQYVPIPRYWDGQARVVYDFGPHETLELGGLVSSDATTRTLRQPRSVAHDAARRPAPTSTASTCATRSTWPDGSIVEVTPSFGTNSTSLVNQYGSTPTELTNVSDVLGLRASWRGPVAAVPARDRRARRRGARSSSLHRLGSIGAPPREGDIYVFGEPPPTQISADDWKTVDRAPSPRTPRGTSRCWTTGFTSSRALRFEPFVTSASKTPPPDGQYAQRGVLRRRRPCIEPRVAVRYAFTPRDRRQGGLRPLPPGCRSPRTSRRVFGNPTLGLSSRRALPRRRLRSSSPPRSRSR